MISRIVVAPLSFRSGIHDFIGFIVAISPFHNILQDGKTLRFNDKQLFLHHLFCFPDYCYYLCTKNWQNHLNEETTIYRINTLFMKRLLTTIQICLAISLSLGGCSEFGKPKKLVYANSHNGFLNIREEPTAKSAIVGRMYNGDEGAEELGAVVGNWIRVKQRNSSGWIHSGYAQKIPSSPALLDAEKLCGVWVARTDLGSCNFATLVFFNDGTYVEGYGGGYHLGGAGRWTLQDGRLVLEQSFDMETKERSRGKKEIVVVREDSIKKLLYSEGDLLYHKESFISERAAKDDLMGRMSQSYYLRAHEEIVPHIK